MPTIAAPTVPSIAAQCFKRMVAPVAALLVVMVALGLLITRVLAHSWPFSVETSVNRGLASERTPEFTTISTFFSNLASTPVIIAVTAVVALILRLVFKRWREPLFLVCAVSAQALVFLLTTLAIDRRRPNVEHLDASPPTSSFPSGHTSAAVALYVGVALLLTLHTRRTAAKAAWWVLLVLVPVSVAVARMYRGMHHPTDVTASFLNGGVCVLVMARALLDRGVSWTGIQWPRTAAAPAQPSPKRSDKA